jgi:hypothetical protein
MPPRPDPGACEAAVRQRDPQPAHELERPRHVVDRREPVGRAARARGTGGRRTRARTRGTPRRRSRGRSARRRRGRRRCEGSGGPHRSRPVRCGDARWQDAVEEVDPALDAPRRSRPEEPTPIRYRGRGSSPSASATTSRVAAICAFDSPTERPPTAIPSNGMPAIAATDSRRSSASTPPCTIPYTGLAGPARIERSPGPAVRPEHRLATSVRGSPGPRAGRTPSPRPSRAAPGSPSRARG